MIYYNHKARAEEIDMSIKELYDRMVIAENCTDVLEKLYEQAPENEEIERDFDEAYKVQFERTEELIKALCKYGYDEKTWRKVLIGKREQIDVLLNKAA
jgi:hypothetical protein